MAHNLYASKFYLKLLFFARTAKKWKADRKIINPFFAHNNLLSLIPTFNDKANNVKNKLARLAGQGEQKIFAILKECGLQLSLCRYIQ